MKRNIVTLMVTGVAACSYYVIERPAARVGKQLTSMISTPTREQRPAAEVVST
jgi:peptidoglycan/LPS O-acetylase OafA/YrhL